MFLKRSLVDCRWAGRKEFHDQIVPESHRGFRCPMVATLIKSKHWICFMCIPPAYDLARELCEAMSLRRGVRKYVHAEQDKIWWMASKDGVANSNDVSELSETTRPLSIRHVEDIAGPATVDEEAIRSCSIDGMRRWV